MDERIKMNFSEALSFLKLKGRVGREGWKDKGRWLWFSTKTEFMEPFIAIRTNGKNYPWFAGQQDLLADDWVRVL